MIDAAMHSGVASVPHAYPHPTMWTYVQRNVNRTIRRPPYDHLILTHVANDIIARFRDLRLMSRSEEHTSELQSLMRISYAVFCLKKKNKPIPIKPLLRMSFPRLASP